jgi:2-polyprenyl-3-methyl-5-hydroxy-6-metoxy-1,4-benzoquinol methylase
MEEINAKNDYEFLKKCPWCGSAKKSKWGRDVRGFLSVVCSNCGLIYVENRLNDKGLKRYYDDYLSKVHQNDMQLNKLRNIMYKLEYDFISDYVRKKMLVLDVGCSGGYFLDYFARRGCCCYGVEFGEEAAKEANMKYIIYLGEFNKLRIDNVFDLIVFRGVIEHISDPRSYLDKAISLLNPGGLIYITSTPNANSMCCKVFEEKWNQHEPEAHLMHFSAKHFDDYFKGKGFSKLKEHCFYRETPYANTEEDILSVAKAIKQKKRSSVSFRSPAFYENMMSLIYRKIAV